MRQKSVIFSFILPVLAIILSLSSCSRNEKAPNGGNAKLEVRLTDSPFPLCEGSVGGYTKNTDYYGRFQ